MTRVAILLLVIALCPRSVAAQHGESLPASSRPPVASRLQEAARVNGVVVTSDRVAAALSVLIPEESFHRNVNAERMTVLRRQALNTVIDDELIYQDARRQRLVIARADQDAAWRQTTARYGGATAFDAALRRAGVSRSAVRQDITRRLLIDTNYQRTVLAHCGVDRDGARQFYESHPERFVEPERLHVHAVTIGVDPSSDDEVWKAAEARANEARLALDQGTPFAEVARTFSTDASKEHGGDLGLVHRGSLASPFEDVVRDLRVGLPSAVVGSLFGYHVVMVSEIQPPQQKTFDDVATSLAKDLTETRCAEQRDGWLTRLRADAQIQISEAVSR